MNILLEDFSTKVDKEDIFKSTVENESLHEIGNENRVVNSGKSALSPYCIIHKFTWIAPDGKTHNQIDHTQTSDGIQVYLMSDRSW
jgi:hypothetical protein